MLFLHLQRKLKENFDTPCGPTVEFFFSSKLVLREDVDQFTKFNRGRRIAQILFYLK